ncbi:DUF397 domain-containing protein [Actinomadura sp. WAC 06369]|uniref:DUF397 domain-containing protein n=1 Tax=Actinomadura sp. WAC 06369 TaxID=2203193 RepID=UPI000F780733|nr:DUF397 domain-containing protein [Actinomadura sp. WAC 06369]RSN71686.1 DUF397 domain-containing protein [Actinomadura sp. WAC 06369]
MTSHDFTCTNWRKSSHSGNNDCVEVGAADPAPATWRKSTHSGTGDCVEAASLEGIIGIRDSKDPDGGVIVLGRREWARLVGTLKATTGK